MEGHHPACTERRNEVEEGWGNDPGRALAVPCAAPGGSAPKQSGTWTRSEPGHAVARPIYPPNPRGINQDTASAVRIRICLRADPAIREAERRFHDDRLEECPHFDGDCPRRGRLGFFLALDAYLATMGHQVAYLSGRYVERGVCQPTRFGQLVRHGSSFVRKHALTGSGRAGILRIRMLQSAAVYPAGFRWLRSIA